jgi:ketosteroid isomerase-like protein
MDYSKYIEAFNAGDDAALVRDFFTPDVLFQSGPRLVQGADELLKFLNWAHDGIREIIRAQVVLRDAGHIFAEIDMDFVATADRPDFTFGALKKGELTTVKFFAMYYLRDGKVAQLKTGRWPPKLGVTSSGAPANDRLSGAGGANASSSSGSLASSTATAASGGATSPVPRLGGSPEQRQAFMEYTRAFSNADFARFSQYYTDDCNCQLASMLLQRKEGIVGFYREMFETVRESLTLHQLVADDNGLAADITSRFTAIEDAPRFVVAPLKKGEFVEVHVFVYYTLRDGKISNIRVARAGPPGSPRRA